MKLSARNQLSGRVVGVEKGQTTGHVRIDIGGGKIVTASITNQAIDELSLAVGDEAAGGSFFALLHAQNVAQVSRDLAEMVRVGKRRVAWLLRVRVGRSWRWVKATATNLLETSAQAIRVELAPVAA